MTQCKITNYYHFSLPSVANFDKDKKSRSTSRTPGEQLPRDDYFEEQPQLSPHDETDALQEPAVNETEPVRDGLAVGYNTEQLELARQLKEEFGSGSKKSKKKDKKRGSLLRSNTEDDFSSESMSRDLDFQDSLEAPQPSNLDTVPDAGDDESANVTKKSKRDKKVKKRGSLVPDTGDDLSESTSRAPGQDENGSTTLAIISDKLSAEPIPIDTMDESPSVTKKEKKEKKDKKDKSKNRNNVVRSMMEDDASDSLSKQVEAFQNASEDKSGEADQVEPLPAEEEDSSFSTKAKKNKKKRQSTVALDDPIEIPQIEAEILPTGEPLTSGNTPASDEYEISSTKKSKKKYKNNRGSLLRNESFDGAFEQQSDERDLQPDSDNSGPTETSSAAIPLIDEPQEDDFQTRSKSKRDKKKRGSLLRNESSDDTLQQESEERPLQLDSDNFGQSENVSAATPRPDEQQDDFYTPSKKSKKGKAKRGSLLRNESFPGQDDSDMQPELENLSARDEVSGDTSSVPLADEEYSFESPKKSKKKDKKDKKKRGSNLDEITEQGTAEPENPETSKDLSELASAVPGGDNQDDVPTKDSNKDKKQQSGVSTPVEVAVVPELESSKAPSEVTSTPTNVLESVGTITALPLTESATKYPDVVDQESQNEASQFTSKVSNKEDKYESVQPSFDAKDVDNSTSKSPSLVGATHTGIPTPASVEELALESISQPVLNEDAAIGEITSQAVDEASRDFFGGGQFTKKSSKKEKKRKVSTKFDSENLSGISTPLDPVSAPRTIDEPSLPAEPVLDSIATPTPTPQDTVEDTMDDWDSFPAERKKDKKMRKDSSKPDLEAISLSSEPTLEPSKDVSLTPLPVDQTIEDSAITETL